MTSLHIQIDDGLMRKSIKTFMEGPAPLLVLTPAALLALYAEAGDEMKAARWLLHLATRNKKPIAVHANDTTWFVSPRGWTQEKLKGYIAVHHEVIEAQFGEITEFTKAGEGHV